MAAALACNNIELNDKYILFPEIERARLCHSQTRQRYIAKDDNSPKTPASNQAPSTKLCTVSPSDHMGTRPFSEIG